jgi:MazG family protein
MNASDRGGGEARGATFPELVRVMERLRGPGGCPWDREQSHASLKPYLIEEAHEALEAIDLGDDEALVEELGDVLLQVVFHAELLREKGAHTIDDVVRAICEKLVRRHPHVFGDRTVSDSGEVLRNWYALKAEERKAKRGAEASALDGVPRSLPGLLRAQRLGEKAASVGFDWDGTDAVVAKLEEELGEIRRAIAEARGASGDATESAERRAHVQAEIGDLCFAAAQLSRHVGVDAEDGLRRACDRFSARFRYVEQTLHAVGRECKGTSMAELEALWVEAKQRVG